MEECDQTCIKQGIRIWVRRQHGGRANFMKKRNVLSLDGGGVRGVVSVAFLERLEQLAETRAGHPVRLCNCFDLIGGTSTGAIIATALATGLSVADIKDFYFKLAPKVFRKSRFRLFGLQHVFDGAILRDEIRGVLGDITLASDRLKTGLAIVTKRVDTGSAWIVTNNPQARYWDDPKDKSYIGNRHLPLVELVRASTAAPHFFAPEKIKIVDGMPPGLFVDGGVTPHNNPALALFQLAAIPAYGYDWPLGADRLSILSVGTGAFRQQLDAATAGNLPAMVLALKGLTGLIRDCEQSVLTTMQMLGLTPDPIAINSEIGDLTGKQALRAPLFSFQRYNLQLDQDWMAETLGQRLSRKEVGDLQKMDNPEIVPIVYDFARQAAELQVKAGHLELFLDTSLLKGHS